MSSEVGNKARYCLSVGAIDFSSDTFKAILMDSGFTFDPDAHDAYADVSADELTNGNGYTTGGETLTGVAITESDVNDRAEITWDNITWTAASGTIGPTPGAIIYDDTVTVSGLVPAKPVIGYIDFGGEQSEPDGGVATIVNPQVNI